MQAVASATPALRPHIPKLNSYIAAAEAFVAGDTDEATAVRHQTLGELLLGLPPPQVTWRYGAAVTEQGIDCPHRLRTLLVVRLLRDVTLSSSLSICTYQGRKCGLEHAQDSLHFFHQLQSAHACPCMRAVITKSCLLGCKAGT